MNYQRSLFIISFIFFINADLLALAQVQCLNNGNYTSDSTYSSNLNATLSSLYTNVDNNGFYNVSVGQGLDRVNGIALCRGDAQLNACRDCTQTSSAELLTSCPNQKQAIRWDELCMSRYTNKSSIGTMESWPSSHLSSLAANATSPEQFQRILRMLLDNLRNKAASGGSQRKVAIGNITGPDFQYIFALFQCTLDLSGGECTRCLIEAAAEIPDFCDRKRGCRVLWPSCNICFEISEFFNTTRLQEFEPEHVPVPVPMVDPPLQSSPGKGDGNTTRIVIVIVVPIVICLILAVIIFLIILAVRTTMVTWITVLVLLAFAGKRRWVLAKEGGKITSDVAMYLVKVVLEERSLVAFASATFICLIAMVCLRIGDHGLMS